MTLPSTKKPVKAPALQLSVQFARGLQPHPREVLPRHRMLRWLKAALEQDAEITVRIVDQEEGRALNQSYRGKDYATNVLTFAYDTEPVIQADLVLCAPVVAQEAKELGKTLEAHYAHLLIHGVLHAQGYDHEHDEAEAIVMEKREIAVLQTLGFANPYPHHEEHT